MLLQFMKYLFIVKLGMLLNFNVFNDISVIFLQLEKIRLMIFYLSYDFSVTLQLY